MTTAAETELEQLLGASVRRMQLALLDLAAAQVRGGVEEARARLSELVAQTLVLADLLGRRRVLLESERAAQFAADGEPVVAPVVFDAAVEDLLRRTPELAETAREVSRLYRTRHVFAIVQSAEVEVTARVARVVAEMVSAGVPSIRAASVVAELEDFSASYAATVYETNAATAYTAGRMAAQQDPGVALVLPAWEVVGPVDSDTRRGRPEDRGENHAAAVGLLAGVTDPVWERATPPFGYRCRHGLRSVSRMELSRRGLLREDGTVERFEPPGFEGFSPHPRFGSSPLRRIYGVGG